VEYKKILQQIKEAYIGILKDNLVGIYVHGSIAFDCFNWEKSDIDFIVVVNDEIPVDIKNALVRETLTINKNAPQKGLEASFVLRKHCTNFQYPTPYDLHFSNTHSKTDGGFDKDLAAHFTVIKNAGIVLYGEPVNDVFGEIPCNFYFDSIKSDIKNAKDEIENNQEYFVLNLCRVLAYMQENLILSKKQGGIWGIKNLDSKFKAAIQSALNMYSSDESVKIDKRLLSDFCDYMLRLINEGSNKCL
jgi:streptomycin 3"-adenylyltransferase